MAKGRPSKYKPDYVAVAVELCKNGATDAELADYFEVHRSTLYLWKATHPDFSDAIKVAKGVADERVIASLYEKAVGYSHEDVHISNHQGKITLTPFVKCYPPDSTAAIFWLKNRRPHEWRDMKAVELTGEGGGPVVQRVERVVVDGEEAGENEEC